ncbi:unnamed protein product [Ascophyllum nodosum]
MFLPKMAIISPKAVLSRPRSLSRSPLIGQGSVTHFELAEQRRFESKNFFIRLSVKYILSVAAVIAIVALAFFYGQTDGPKLVKRNAALVPGDRLKGGEYISFCTSIIATGCKPKYLLLSRDGSLGVYEGSGPHARETKLWSAGSGSKGNVQSVHELVYTGYKIILNKNGKMRWVSPVKALPKDLQPWPFRP